MGAEKRIAERKYTETIEIVDITSLTSYIIIAKKAQILNASTSGFLMQIERTDFEIDELKNNINIDTLLNEKIVLFLPQMNLDLEGLITRTKHLGKGVFEVAAQFSANVPEYWKECLIDLLPEPGEFSEDED